LNLVERHLFLAADYSSSAGWISTTSFNGWQQAAAGGYMKSRQCWMSNISAIRQPRQARGVEDIMLNELSGLPQTLLCAHRERHPCKLQEKN
jgi:hypothetical protein